jgi:hypothetical protein
MNFRFWTAVSAAAVSAVMLANGPVLAQTSLRQNVANQLAAHHIKVENLNSLSNTDLAAIQVLLNTTEGSDAQKNAIVQAYFTEKAPCEGNPQLRQNVANQLSEHNIEVKNFDNITGTQLVMIKTVLDSPYSNATKSRQIQQIFATKEPMSGSDYLRADAAQCAKMVGADVDVTKLSPDQLLQIQVISNGTEPANDKRRMMESLAK